jgi:hypothetical protein
MDNSSPCLNKPIRVEAHRGWSSTNQPLPILSLAGDDFYAVALNQKRILANSAASFENRRLRGNRRGKLAEVAGNMTTRDGGSNGVDRALMELGSRGSGGEFDLMALPQLLVLRLIDVRGADRRSALTMRGRSTYESLAGGKSDAQLGGTALVPGTSRRVQMTPLAG